MAVNIIYVNTHSDNLSPLKPENS